jgi:hypothetical protein
MVERETPGYVPPGWPEAVRPPGSEDWEASAAAWLLDLIPEYRLYPTVRRYPVVLAFIARHVLKGAVEGARQGYRTIRSNWARWSRRTSSTRRSGTAVRREGAWRPSCGPLSLSSTSCKPGDATSIEQQGAGPSPVDYKSTALFVYAP